eukprot:TRINITY_DN13775_c0_g1_i3.p1 TRINITY_DN13775_c0_g1~~TRINITY_DN13775_c0_g1_i3.p1  ORF type:complete len:207 (-),score=26.83 TRINITY_DN13775_c0_g1_i3:75-695(-)
MWNDSIEKKKYHLVRWATVCKPLSQGGLGIRSIVKMNKASLGKWLWRVGELGHGLWKQILICKYKLTNDGWYVPNQFSKLSGFWKSILYVKEELFQWIRYKARNGVLSRFWQDEWCGHNSLASQFSNLFLLDQRQHALVSDCFCHLGGRVVWDFSVRRNLMDSEVANFALMLGMLEKVYFSPRKSDVGLWNPDVKVNSPSNLFIMC